MIIYDILLFVLCYLIGSIPSGLIIGKVFKNIDIRNHGSGNLGGTNAIRVLGKKLGVVVAIMDVLKGVIPILLSKFILAPYIELPYIFFGLAAVLGHIYPIFASFRGGKAVATSGGVLLLSSWPIFVIGLITFIVTLLVTRIVSISSTMVAIVIFISTTIAYFYQDIYPFDLFDSDIYFLVTVFILFSFVILRHIPNYKRLLKGTERKIGQKKHD